MVGDTLKLVREYLKHDIEDMMLWFQCSVWKLDAETFYQAW